MDVIEALEEDPRIVDDDFVDYLERVDEEAELEEELDEALPRPRAPKRYIRDVQNPLEVYEDHQFKRRNRFHKDCVMNFILPKLSPQLEKDSSRGLPIAPVFQLLVALRFYATGSFQVSFLS